MVARLTEEQRGLIAQSAGKPIEVLDPQTNQLFVLMGKNQFEMLRPLFEPVPLSEQERNAQLLEMGKRAGWDDPAFDVYNLRS